MWIKHGCSWIRKNSRRLPGFEKTLNKIKPSKDPGDRTGSCRQAAWKMGLSAGLGTRVPPTRASESERPKTQEGRRPFRSGRKKAVTDGF